MRPLHSLNRHPAARLLAALLALLAVLPIGWQPPEPARARPATPAVSAPAGGAFGNAVPCLAGPDTFVTTRFANTIYFPTGSRLDATAARALPAVQTLTAAGAGPALADLHSVGAVYGLAYDDGRASGRERLFAAAVTKRLTGYGPAGAGGLYVFQRVGAGWSLLGSVAVPGAVAANRSGAGDTGAVAGVGKTSLGDIEVGPDGRSLYVVNIGPKRIERFDLLGGALPTHQSSIAIGLDRISTDPAARADLWPFALEFYPFPMPPTASQQVLVVGVTDSAERGLSRSPYADAAGNFAVSPQAHVLVYNVATGGWWKDLTQDLGNSPTLADRHQISQFGTFIEGVSPGTWKDFPVKGWNPWRGTLGTMAVTGSRQVYYPQPILADIEFMSFQPAPGAPAWDTPLMALGLRDRTGDQVFNASLTAPLPGDEYGGVSQGDTLLYRHNGSQWALQSGEAFDDNSHYGGPSAHIENHMGALASVPNDQTTVTALGEALASTALGGLGSQEVRIFGRAAGPGASGSNPIRPGLIGVNTHAASKASNLGDLELLCAHALVGGRLWHDANDDGVQNDGVAANGYNAIAGVTLEVFDNSGLPAPATAPALARATTDSQGRYLFAVPPNTPLGVRIAATSRAALTSLGYRNYAPQHRGSDRAADSDLNQIWGFVEFAPPGSSRTGSGSAQTPLWREGEGRTYDIGLRRTEGQGTIGDFAWNDADADGAQDASEQGIAGVTVTLESYGEAAPLATVGMNTDTDSLGRYRFRNLPPGVYRLRFAVPAGFQVTPRDRAGGDDTRDSDADGSGATAAFTLADNQLDLTRDLGLVARADVAIAKAAPAAALAGGLITYTLTARNLAASPALGAVVADTLPAGLTYVAATPAPTSHAGQALSWSLGDLAGGAVRTISVSARAPVAFTPAGAVTMAVTNCATVTAGSPDADPANNSACATTTLQRPEVGIVKTGPAAPVLVGDEFAYTLAYANSGSAAAGSVTIADSLPTGLTFVRFAGSPTGCSATPSSISCAIASLPPGAGGSVGLVARAEVASVGASVTNTATVGTATPGDDPGNNTSTTTTAIQFPNPRVSLRVNPRPLPVGEPGSLTASYGNAGSGLARATVLTITHDPGPALGAPPAGCTYNAPLRRAVCALGDLPVGATGAVTLPLRLPATPLDASSYPADSFAATVEIAGATPERAADRADNAASDTVAVVRPNVYVTAGGPDASVRLAWGSGFVYEVGYGNLHRAAPDLTRAATGSVLTVTLPADVEFLEASVPPSTVSGQVLVWELGTLAPQAAAGLRLAVRTGVPAGALLHMEAEIGTSTPGDDPSDNRAALETTVVRPPEAIPPTRGTLRLAIHSELDPRHGGADPADGVYLTPEGATGFAWPAGEVLDFTPRLDAFERPADPGWPLEYRARVTGWGLSSFTGNGREAAATAADGRGVAGCRGAGAPPAAGSALVGCAYSYPGAHAEGRALDDFLPAAALREADMAAQAHVYWTQPPAPPMRPDVYLYTLAPLAPPRLAVAVEVELWVVNACPDFLLDPLGACGDPVEMPEPPRARQAIGGSFDVTLVVPRSVVGPSGLVGR
ncbi:MAG TPA: SdrD B-like domain-containing protein [Chloroflexaceae bacterium]|nr:SdrD B-like domain-containing protein [Chloroflexaceae bacterium]